jgi:hypothetical protein
MQGGERREERGGGERSKGLINGKLLYLITDN